MKRKKILSTSDEKFNTVETRVMIVRDECPPDPLHDFDQVFLLHSNIPQEFCGNEHDKDYNDPLVEIEDEDGYGTGRYTFREGVIAFPVSAYIHSGIALRMGSIREFPCDPGGWDTTPNAAYLWTDKDRYEKMCDKWMTVYDEKLDKRRPAKDMEEFRKYLYEVAKSELNRLMQTWRGDCYCYYTEKREAYKKVYPDGREVETVEYVDGDDACGGYFPGDGDKFGDIDAPKSYGDDIEWFSKDDYIAGHEYSVPEFVITTADLGGANRKYLESYTEQEGQWGSVWTSDKSRALKFPSWYRPQAVAQKVLPKGQYHVYTNIKEIDSIKKETLREVFV